MYHKAHYKTLRQWFSSWACWSRFISDNRKVSISGTPSPLGCHE